MRFIRFRLVKKLPDSRLITIAYIDKSIVKNYVKNNIYNFDIQYTLDDINYYDLNDEILKSLDDFADLNYLSEIQEKSDQEDNDLEDNKEKEVRKKRRKVKDEQIEKDAT